MIFWGDMPQRRTANRDWFLSQSSDMLNQKFDHPSTKRLDVVRFLVCLASEESDVIVDPFLGSGTLARAAKDCGRSAIGIEIEERYCEIAAQRCSQEVLEFAS